MKTLIEAGSESEASWLHGRKTKPGDALTSKTKDTKCPFQTWTLERACCNALDDAGLNPGSKLVTISPLNLGRLPHGIWDVFVEIQGYIPKWIKHGIKWLDCEPTNAHRDRIFSPAIVILFADGKGSSTAPTLPKRQAPPRAESHDHWKTVTKCCLMMWWKTWAWIW